MMRVLTDFHHSSLLRSLHLLFEKRLHMMLYRPIGMDWFSEGYWAINDLEDTAKQFLSIEQAAPRDGTPALNKLSLERDEILSETDVDGVHYVMDPGGHSYHRACTLEFFKSVKFDYVIASVPAHVPIFKRLIGRYQPQAKLIVQMGNNWQGYDFGELPVLASVKGPLPHAKNAIFYHQEFDLDVFHATTALPTKKIYSFTNVIRDSEVAWRDFTGLRDLTEYAGIEWRAYGGQCPDGNMTGSLELANKMREAAMIFHVKPGGDGFGHVIHNAYAVGRPVITRRSDYRNQLAEDLMIPGTFIDLDEHWSFNDPAKIIADLQSNPEQLAKMGQNYKEAFDRVVDYTKEAKEIRTWLTSF